MKMQTIETMRPLVAIGLGLGLLSSCGEGVESGSVDLDQEPPASNQRPQVSGQRPSAPEQGLPESNEQVAMPSESAGVGAPAAPPPGPMVTVPVNQPPAENDPCAGAGACVEQCNSFTAGFPANCATGVRTIGNCIGAQTGSCEQRYVNCLAQNPAAVASCSTAP